MFSLSGERDSRSASAKIPYSLVAAIDGRSGPDAIYLNEWAAKDLGAKIGDR